MELDPSPVNLHDWLILDALSDDFESVEQIIESVQNEWPSVTATEVIDRLERLYAAGHVFLNLGATFDRAGLYREISETMDRQFWFGRTLSGDVLWKQRQ